MAYELKPGSGTLFENDRKATDSHPDMTGSININGVEHWFSGWWKQGSKGQFLSVSIGKEKQQQAQRPQAPQQRTAPQRPGQRPAPRQPAGFDDEEAGDVPF